ncbi:hypothetical protein KXD93_09125 [Mucilaginibacter sp. BJC16-A38]|uniref:hypothetical protein n=1 Tax=Mucilaginibacter phenanthrenivorans TaxID=1234842 RepID=UPI0021580ED4|nr:hypothetical protein [Mucilaginibacter phenanthrenivorans]MCR8557802.1 hypothetical protein [Mucilaginibacter phenanthrenivorans]
MYVPISTESNIIFRHEEQSFIVNLFWGRSSDKKEMDLRLTSRGLAENNSDEYQKSD